MKGEGIEIGGRIQSEGGRGKISNEIHSTRML